MFVLYLLTGRFEGKSAREIICKLPQAASSEQDKEPASPRGNRVIRLQIIRGDGSKTEVGVYRDARRGAVPKKRQERRREAEDRAGGTGMKARRRGVLLASLPRSGENARKKCSNVRRRAGGRLLPLHEYE